MKIILLAAITLNGKIAQFTEQPATWTSKEDKQFFVQESKANRVIIMGHNTFKTLGKPLPGRLNVVLTSQPEKFTQIAGQIEFVNLSPKTLLEQLSDRGFDKATLGGGTQVYSEFLAAGLVDELKLTVEPKIFGKGLNLFSEMDICYDLQLMEVKKLGPNVIMLHYKILK
jgi:dihydrofolate reductase